MRVHGERGRGDVSPNPMRLKNEGCITIDGIQTHLKGLPPALRRKKRYIAFEVYSDGDIDGNRLFRAISETMLSLFGELKFLGLELKHFDGKRGILKCYREALKDVKFGLNLVDRVDERRIAIRILGVSGTIKSCMRKFLRR